MKIVGAMRVKNESRWIARAVQSILPVCSRVYVFDDSSVDTTAKEARDAGAEVILSRLKGTDEVRDKNLLLDLIGSRVPDTDWIIMIDGDEVLQHAERLEDTIRQTPMDCVSLPVLYLWDREDQVRIDGVYGNFRRESAFRLTAERFRATTHGGNFHCGNVPAGLRSRRAYVDSPLLHYGYMHQSDRMRKYDWYRLLDPDNRAEDGYRHMVVGDVFPADSKFQHGGPLALRAL